MNVAFAASSIPILRYSVATSIALIKCVLHVYIGSTLRSLADEGSGQSNPARIVALVAGLVLGLGVFIYLTYVVRKVLLRNHIEGDSEGDSEEVHILRYSEDHNVPSRTSLENGRMKKPFGGRQLVSGLTSEDDVGIIDNDALYDDSDIDRLVNNTSQQIVYKRI